MALTETGARQTERLALHVGLMVTLLQRGAPLSLIKVQCLHLRGMLSEYIDLDEDNAAFVQVSQLLPDDVADALTENPDIPDDISSLDDSVDPQDER